LNRPEDYYALLKTILSAPATLNLTRDGYFVLRAEGREAMGQTIEEALEEWLRGDELARLYDVVRCRTSEVGRATQGRTLAHLSYNPLSDTYTLYLER
jgi:hypothetical protein